MPNYSQGLSGAASGASIGTAIAPGIGTAIGAIGGGLLGAFGGGGKKENPARKRMLEDNRELYDMMQKRWQSSQNQSASDTNLYQQGMAQIREESERQADRDDARAAARGLQGSEYEIAQGQKRMSAMASSQRNLLAQGENMQRQQEGRYLNSMMQSRGMLNNAQMGKASVVDRRRARGRQNMASAFGSLTDLATMYSKNK